MAEILRISEPGQTLEFSFADMLKYHGGGSPAGVATAFKVLQRAFAVLSPDEPPLRREVVVRTAFRGPGARDGFELVTRAVTDERYLIDRTLTRSDRGRLLEDFVFEVTIGDNAVTLLLRDGFVTEEFIDLARQPDRSAAQEQRLDALKAELAERLMATDAADVYDVAG